MDENSKLEKPKGDSSSVDQKIISHKEIQKKIWKYEEKSYIFSLM